MTRRPGLTRCSYKTLPLQPTLLSHHAVHGYPSKSLVLRGHAVHLSFFKTPLSTVHGWAPSLSPKLVAILVMAARSCSSKIVDFVCTCAPRSFSSPENARRTLDVRLSLIWSCILKLQFRLVMVRRCFLCSKSRGRYMLAASCEYKTLLRGFFSSPSRRPRLLLQKKKARISWLCGRPLPLCHKNIIRGDLCGLFFCKTSMNMMYVCTRSSVSKFPWSHPMFGVVAFPS